MKKQIKNKSLYAIVSMETHTLEEIETIAKSGTEIIQLREKNLDKQEYINRAIAIKQICDQARSIFIVNDDVEVAKAVRADGVHLGVTDMNLKDAREYLGEDFIIGITAKTPELAKFAKDNGADYIGVGAFFPSKTKKDALPITIAEFGKILEIDIPTFIIGGITHANLQNLMLEIEEHSSNYNLYGVVVGDGLLNHTNPQFTKLQNISRNVALIRSLISLKKGISLSIAGSDSSGGAGIQADIKAFSYFGVYGETVITAITSQNTTGVSDIHLIPPNIVASQLKACFDDIRPLSVKLGMLGESESIKKIIGVLKYYAATNIVVDPVMFATSGSKLISDGVFRDYEQLMKMAILITPNIQELSILTNLEINNLENAIEAGKILSKRLSTNVLVKSGHLVDTKTDVLIRCDGSKVFFEGKNIDTPNTHGTGCTLSSSIAACLSLGYSLEDSIKTSKEYLEKLLRNSPDLGRGSGPLWHN